MTTLKRLPLVFWAAFAVWAGASPALAQRLITESVTPEFTDYRLENPTLHLAPHYEMLIPFGRGDGSFLLLNVGYRLVEFESDTTDVFTAKVGSANVDAPLFETHNEGIFRKKTHATLKINVTRPVIDQEHMYQVAEHVSFRVYNDPWDPRAIDATAFAATSPLAGGIWHKIPIHRSGVYRLDRNYLAALTGLNVASLDPRRLQIWAGSNAMLPMLNATARPEFLQVPIIVNGEADGRFDNDDSVVFYAQGPQRLVFNESNGRFKGETHLYSKETYVFITVGNENGLRFVPVSGQSPTQTETTFTDVLFKEEELYKIASEMRSGSEWLGERVTPGSVGSTLTVMDSVIAGFVPGSTVTVDIRLASRNRGNARFETRLGTSAISTLPFQGLFLDYSSAETGLGYAQDLFTAVSNVTLANNRLQITSTYSSDTPSEALGYLDFANVYVQRSLTATNGLLKFYSPSNVVSETWATYTLNGFGSAPLVFDVTDPQRPAQYAATGQGNTWSVVAPAQRGRQLIAATALLTPGAATAVPNQHIRSIADFPDYLIVTPNDPAFMPMAQELAAFRQANDGLRPAIVTQGQIFNEYSGGVPDVVAIRDFVRHIYLKAGTVESQFPQHLLLFGNATHDFRGIYGTELSEKNLVFTYQSRDSFHRVDSYGSDDYYGLLDTNEGVWANNTTSELIDLGIGRLPFNTPEEAAVLVRKLKSYEDPSTFGDWRTLFTFAADDDIPDPYLNRDLHILNADSTAEFINKDISGVRLRKIYEINYPVETTSGARFRPLATRDFIDSFNNGSLVVNYSGHGAEQTLSDSRLFQSSDISRLTNRDRLSIFVTATCSFGRFDDHLDQSGAEKTLLWPDGGIIAAFTTTRVVYTGSDPNTVNFGLNRRLSGFMAERDEEGLPRRLGDIFWRTKNVTANNLGGSFNSRKFILLGDPAMRIGLPRQKAQIDRVQGQALPGEQTLTLRALDTVQIEGSVTHADGSVNTSYNGEINLKVFDGTRFVQLPEREWMSNVGCYLRNCRYREQNDLLFNGRVSVANGRYTANFVVPKDISYSQNPGRLLVYGQSGGNDAVGSFSRVVFNGLNPDAQNDNRGPQMQVYLDSPEFADGAMVGSNPKLFVELSDATGINATGTGVGHEIVATLNTVPERTFVLNNYFQTDLDDFRSGRIEYPLDGLQQGEYELTVRAWDVFNNPTEERITFRVADSEDITLSNVFNYPNPMHNRTRFQFEHNQPGNQLDVSVRIFTLSGRPVAQIEESRVFPTSQGSVEWLGFDNDNDRLATGTYLYVLKVTAETSKGRRSTDVIEKLVIIR